jgi:prepilin-type processing-associated H-X9-DG protein
MWLIDPHHEGRESVWWCPSRPARVYPVWAYEPMTARMGDHCFADAFHPGLIARGRVGVRVTQVTRGMSHTLLAAEKAINIAQAAFGRNWDDDFGRFSGWDWDSYRSTSAGPPLPDYQGTVGDATWPLGYSTQHGEYRFGSAHPGGLNCLYGDGSVRWVTFDVDPALWAESGKRW